MSSTHLNEHDANQGAQSSGEFLGMTGNCGWYLLGSGGATILMVIVLWGICGLSLVLCLLAGVLLCLGSVAYVFGLKNNRPEHYDTDFFESALVEAGVWEFSFGPRLRRPRNPFRDDCLEVPAKPAKAESRSSRPTPAARRGRSGSSGSPAPRATAPGQEETKANGAEAGSVVPRVVLERLQEQLTTTEEMLEDALTERGED